MADLGVIFYFGTMTDVSKYFPQRASQRWEDIHFNIHFTFVNFSCFFLQKSVLIDRKRFRCHPRAANAVFGNVYAEFETHATCGWKLQRCRLITRTLDLVRLDGHGQTLENLPPNR